MPEPESDKQRRQRELDHLAFKVLAAQHTKWTRWTDWFELTKAKWHNGKLGDDTFCQAVKRLLNKQKIRQSQIAKNRFYGVIFTSGSSSEVISSYNPVAPAPDKAAQALEHLLNRKPPSVL
jgi:hypothetical protein